MFGGASLGSRADVTSKEPLGPDLDVFNEAGVTTELAFGPDSNEIDKNNLDPRADPKSERKIT